MSDQSDIPTELGPAVCALSAGQVVFGRYELRRKLGEGNFGAVWLVYDRRLREEVALKFVLQAVATSPEAIDDLITHGEGNVYRSAADMRLEWYSLWMPPLVAAFCVSLRFGAWKGDSKVRLFFRCVLVAVLAEVGIGEAIVAIIASLKGWKDLDDLYFSWIVFAVLGLVVVGPILGFVCLLCRPKPSSSIGAQKSPSSV